MKQAFALPDRLHLAAFRDDPSIPERIRVALGYVSPDHKLVFGDAETIRQMEYLERILRLWNSIVLGQAPDLIEQCGECDGTGECPHCSHLCDECDGRGYAAADDLSGEDRAAAEHACAFLHAELDWMHEIRSSAVYSRHPDVTPEPRDLRFDARAMAKEVVYADHHA